MQVRRYLSRAEVARCSFKDKAVAEVDVLLFIDHDDSVLTPIQVIALTFQVAIEAIAKCLQLFAEDQQCVHSSSFFAYR